MSGTNTVAPHAPIIHARYAVIIVARSSHARGRGTSTRLADDGEHAGGGRGKSLNGFNGLSDKGIDMSNEMNE